MSLLPFFPQTMFSFFSPRDQQGGEKKKTAIITDPWQHMTFLFPYRLVIRLWVNYTHTLTRLGYFVGSSFKQHSKNFNLNFLTRKKWVSGLFLFTWVDGSITHHGSTSCLGFYWKRCQKSGADIIRLPLNILKSDPITRHIETTAILDIFQLFSPSFQLLFIPYEQLSLFGK